jgi:kynurenine formamidase
MDDLFPFRLVDLTHPLHPGIPAWGGRCGFELETVSDYGDADSAGFRIQRFGGWAGVGTHLDAPAHGVPSGRDSAGLPLESLTAPCVVVDVSEKAHDRYEVSRVDLEGFESRCGAIPPGSLVFIRTGWERFWNEPERFWNGGIFPSVSSTAAEFLLKRDVNGLGVDTLSPDSSGGNYPVHRLFLGAGKCLVENAAHLDLLPPTGAYVMALPLPVVGGTESPVRLVGLVRK